MCARESFRSGVFLALKEMPLSSVVEGKVGTFQQKKESRVMLKLVIRIGGYERDFIGYNRD